MGKLHQQSQEEYMNTVAKTAQLQTIQQVHQLMKDLQDRLMQKIHGSKFDATTLDQSIADVAAKMSRLYREVSDLRQK